MGYHSSRHNGHVLVSFYITGYLKVEKILYKLENAENFAIYFLSASQNTYFTINRKPFLRPISSGLSP